MEVGVGESSVGKTVAEGEERIDGAFVVGAISDVYTLKWRPRFGTVRVRECREKTDLVVENLAVGFPLITVGGV